MGLAELDNVWSEAYDDIMQELYSEAVPGTDYSSVVEEGTSEDEPALYLQHFLEGERQEEIIEDVLDEYEIPEELYFDAKKAVMLSHGPSASVSTVDRAREEAGLEPVSEMLDGENQR